MVRDGVIVSRFLEFKFFDSYSYVSYLVILKLLRANGGCLGIWSR